MDTRNFTTRDLCLIGVFTAAIIILAQISIPMPYGVPMTLQTFIIPLTGVVLGVKRATLSTIIYVLLGAVGVPVFAGLAGGLGIILGPTGGFILTFPIVAITAGLGAGKDSKVWLYFWLVVGSVINYLCGMVMYAFVANSTLAASFTACVLPFIPTAIVKVILSGILGLKCKDILCKGGLLA